MFGHVTMHSLTIYLPGVMFKAETKLIDMTTCDI